MNYFVSDIVWETDFAEDLNTLPTQTYIEAVDEDFIADALSDEYGFLVESFNLH